MRVEHFGNYRLAIFEVGNSIHATVVPLKEPLSISNQLVNNLKQPEINKAFVEARKALLEKVETTEPLVTFKRGKGMESMSNGNDCLIIILKANG